jgi:hypothetical protein
LWNLKQGFSEEDVFTFFCPFHFPFKAFALGMIGTKKSGH